MVDRRASAPLYQQIQENLYDQIRSGELAAGARVPSESDLVNQYGVSRMTARRALDELVNKGLLFRQQGKGTFVADGVLTYGLSTMLSFSGTLRTLGHEVTTSVLYQGVALASSEVSERLRLAKGGRVVLVRRLRTVDGKPAAIHTSFLNHELFAPILDIDLSANSLLASIEQISGARITHTQDGVRASLVSAEDRSILGITEGSPVLDVEGMAYSGNGQPLRYTRAIYRSDLFRLVVTNAGEPGAALTLTNGHSPSGWKGEIGEIR
ncbi:MAG: phosphonate metabolism transcriptional regulator PhnF [Caldilineaceae bacterium]|nr:phosphonate metabolism transcriptional regulator PhnF [Caldilineaceae bacterium]